MFRLLFCSFCRRRDTQVAKLVAGPRILFIGPRASDVHLLCDQSRQQAQYFHCNVGDVDGVYAALEKLGAADSNRRA